MDLPSFLNVTQPSIEWPVARERRPRSNSDETKARILSQYETVFPRVMDQVYAGFTLSKAVSELPIQPPIDYGTFNRWVMKDASRRAIYEEAQEFRAEVYADRMVAHAEGETDHELDRSRFAVDVYKFLMSRHSKRRYGETKTIEVTQNISITAALEQSRQRVIEAAVIDDDTLTQNEYRLLVDSVEDDDETTDEDE